MDDLIRPELIPPHLEKEPDFKTVGELGVVRRMKLVKLKFVKIHGLGNDLCYFPTDPGLGSSKIGGKVVPPTFWDRCRWTGVALPGKRAAGRCVSLMPMGRKAEMCGMRCALLPGHLVESGREKGPEVAIGTAGVKPATILPEGEVRVDMGTDPRELLHLGGRRATPGH